MLLSLAARRAHPLALLLGGIALLTAASLVRVPMWPVPMTLQTLAVLLIGAVAGARIGVASVAGWMALGALGLPVLAGGQALGGPTFGYILGFAAAAALVGTLVARGATTGWRLLLALLAGEAVIFALGLTWLRLGWVPSLEATLAAGLLPFIPGEGLKLALAFALLGVQKR